LLASTALSSPPEGLLLHDGREIAGEILALKDGALWVEGRTEPVPLYEVGAVLFSAGAEEGEKEEASRFNSGPMVRFRDNETLSGRVASATAVLATVKVEAAGAPSGAVRSPAAADSLPLFNIPLENLKGFRLREAHLADDLFESDLKGPPPQKDRVYVRRQGNLLPVEGVFQSLDEESLTLEYEGQARKLKRQTVLGVVFAPMASRSVEGDLPAVFELGSEGRFPAYFKGLRGEHARREILLRHPGAPSDSLEALPVGRVRRVKFSSDRVLFLSSAQPVHVEEVPLLGTKSPFPWRKDQAASGGPLLLAGKAYPKGMGVHSRSILEYDLKGLYRSFASVAGLDDGAAEGAGVTFRVFADGKEIFKKDMVQGGKPEYVLLPMQGVGRLRLEVDYGEDGTDFGDQADWAEARVTK
jgi:hypothetical protein